MLMYRIYKKFDIASAHQLKGHPKCGKLHGHNYNFEVWIESESLSDDYGFILDFAAFKEIEKKYDHSDVVINISSEDLAEEVAQQIQDILFKDRGIEIDCKITVRIWESDHTYAEYELKK